MYLHGHKIKQYLNPFSGRLIYLKAQMRPLLLLRSSPIKNNGRLATVPLAFKDKKELIKDQSPNFHLVGIFFNLFFNIIN
jgi:hypothetical protein